MSKNIPPSQKWKIRERCVVVFLFLSFGIMASLSLASMWPDNPIEEATEHFIEEKTGVEIEFTPAS